MYFLFFVGFPTVTFNLNALELISLVCFYLKLDLDDTYTGSVCAVKRITELRHILKIRMLSKAPCALIYLALLLKCVL